MEDKSPVSKIFSQLGISKSMQRIKFGGVVGKQTLLGVIGSATLVSIAWGADATTKLVIAVLAGVLLILVALLNFSFANKHAAEAMLEGTEMLAFQHQVHAAKSAEVPQNAPVIPNPGGSAPQLNPSQETEQ
ncbi:MAG TPA: hypothetical protein VGR03_17070 [Candidatus Acidoferrum sp.]|nr:hypothetical protein [Candidatus Acidoferrum sp.]